MGIPRYRTCDECAKKGVEKRIGTADSPMIQINVGVLEGALAFDAKLPRWAWKGFTRFDPRNRSQDDDQPGQLESTALRQELCIECAQAMLTADDAHEVRSQRQYRNDKRAEHARQAADLATARAAVLAAQR